MKLNQTAKRIVCFALSALLLFGTVTPAFAATNETKKRDIFAEIIASIDIANKRIEKKVETHIDENMNPALAATEELLATSDNDVEKAMGLISEVVSSAETELEEGSANSEEAKALLNAIVDTQTKAEEANETSPQILPSVVRPFSNVPFTGRVICSSSNSYSVPRYVT